MSIARHRIIPLLLLSLTTSACQDKLVSPADSVDLPRPQFAQGDGGTWTVSTLQYQGDGTCDDSCTLGEAIVAAASGDRIVFAPGLNGDVMIPAGETGYDIGKSLTIDGDRRIALNGDDGTRVMSVGGAVEVTLQRVTIRNGFAVSGGGAIATNNGATLRLEEVTLEDNESQDSGGGVYVGIGTSLTLVNTTIRGNLANTGGGVYNVGTLLAIGNTFSGNTASVNGGGLLVTSQGSATIERSTFSGNRAGTPSVGVGRGGGIYSAGATTIRSTTITLNDAKGQDGFSGGLHAEGNVRVANSIIIGNRTDEGDEDCGGPGFLISLGYTLRRDNFCQFDDPAASDVHVETAQFFTEVLDQELKDNGGPTLTHALIVRGRAVDAGYCPGETNDQRGLARPIDDATMPNALDGCDIGSYEAQGPFVPQTDLMVSQSANKTSVKAGDLLTYTVRVRNLGPETAPNVVMTNVLSSGVTFVSATHSKGNHTAPPAGETGTVTWYLGEMLDQANEVAEITVTVRIKGKSTIINTASVTGDVNDPNSANNSASLTVSVGAGSTGRKR